MCASSHRGWTHDPGKTLRSRAYYSRGSARKPHPTGCEGFHEALASPLTCYLIFGGHTVLVTAHSTCRVVGVLFRVHRPSRTRPLVWPQQRANTSSSSFRRTSRSPPLLEGQQMPIYPNFVCAHFLSIARCLSTDICSPFTGGGRLVRRASSRDVQYYGYYIPFFLLCLSG